MEAFSRNKYCIIKKREIKIQERNELQLPNYLEENIPVLFF